MRSGPASRRKGPPHCGRPTSRKACGLASSHKGRGPAAESRRAGGKKTWPAIFSPASDAGMTRREAFSGRCSATADSACTLSSPRRACRRSTSACHRFAAGALATLGEQAARMTGKCFRRLGPQADALDRGRQFEPLQALAEHANDPLGITRGAGKTKDKHGRRPLRRAALVCELENAFTDSTTTCSKPATQGMAIRRCAAKPSAERIARPASAVPAARQSAPEKRNAAGGSGNSPSARARSATSGRHPAAAPDRRAASAAGRQANAHQSWRDGPHLLPRDRAPPAADGRGDAAVRRASSRARSSPPIASHCAASGVGARAACGR
jgi:hypothetical protein